jgi:hypothetical protein
VRCGCGRSRLGGVDFIVFVCWLYDDISDPILFEYFADSGPDKSDSSGLDVGVCTVQGRRPYQEDQYAVCRIYITYAVFFYILRRHCLVFSSSSMIFYVWSPMCFFFRYAAF